MVTIIAVVAALGLLVLTGLFGWKLGREGWGEHLAGAEAVLAIAALAAGGAWYLVARPDAPKLRLDQDLESYSLPKKQALVLAEISLSNVGGSALELHTPYKLFLQQVTPLPQAAIREAQQPPDPEYGLQIYEADTWSSLAKRQDRFDTVVESGETENYYFRSVINCKPGLRVSLATWVDKPRSRFSQYADTEAGAWVKRLPFAIQLFYEEKQLTWIKQSTLDLSDQCGEALQ